MRKDWPKWMDDPLEYWDEDALHVFMKTHRRGKPILLDDFIDWVEARSSYVARIVKFWRNKYVEETL